MDVSLPEGSVTVIPNGVPPLDLDPPPRDIADPLVGVIARFDPVKGVDVAMRAMAPLLAELERQIKRHDGLKRLLGVL